MPIYDFQCPKCGNTAEYLVVGFEDKVHCFQPECIQKNGDTLCIKLPGAPSVKIKGPRAANGYGLKYEDTYGKSPVNGKETGCSFTSNRGFTLEHKFQSGGSNE